MRSFACVHWIKSTITAALCGTHPGRRYSVDDHVLDICAAVDTIRRVKREEAAARARVSPPRAPPPRGVTRARVGGGGGGGRRVGASRATADRGSWCAVLLVGWWFCVRVCVCVCVCPGGGHEQAIVWAG